MSDEKATRMTPQQAELVLRALDGEKLPTSTAEAKKVLRALFTARYGQPDRWGNFKVGDSQRLQLGDVVVRLQSKHSKEAGGAWFNVQSKPLIDYSIGVIALAARTLGREELAARATTKKSGRADARKTAATKRAVVASKRDAAENGPGFYVRNKARSIHGITADHERPFGTLEEAITFAKKRYADFMSMRFDYLLPVTVVRAGSRHDALFGDPWVYWIDGKSRGQPVDPRQLAMGFSSGRAHLYHTFRSIPVGGVFRFRDNQAIYRKVDTSKYVLVGGDKTVYTQTRDKQVTYVTD